MNKPQTILAIGIILVLFSTVVLTACGSSTSANSAANAPTSSVDAAALMSQQCARCHPISRVTSKTKTAEQWKVTVDRMIKHGAQITPTEEQALVDYLAQNY